ncbi:MAG: type II toxin-antitoxin system RelE family toxin [Acidimicrobiales bacterium]
MTRYRVEIARRALKSLAALPRREQQRVRAAIDLLAEHPRPPGCVALRLAPDRVRVGDYRIVYELFDERLVVHVVRIGQRRDIYRKLLPGWLGATPQPAAPEIAI